MMRSSKPQISEVRTRRETAALKRYLREKYKDSGKTNVYPMMAFNFIALGDGEDEDDPVDDVFGVRFTIRHGVLDTFHLHDIGQSSPGDVCESLKNFLQTAFSGEPIIVAEGERDRVVKFLDQYMQSEGKDLMSSTFTIWELQICFFDLLAHQFFDNHTNTKKEGIIEEEFRAIKSNHQIALCCRFFAWDVVFDLYSFCRMIDLSSNVYFGENIWPPGEHMFGLVFPFPEDQMLPESLEGNRLWQAPKNAQEAKNRNNYTPHFCKKPRIYGREPI
ncbi:hypothetical protein QR680_007954 [Steinernema hermaphroditum]|uniref:Uncharacterized protein n=1 Tax=Steinernema hermaphroditum TaxID=289476 RepID=A0AA39M6S8_9BILA|nr:hypothetical protein QR680_007954 [Steinernema hermaphroditum]